MKGFSLKRTPIETVGVFGHYGNKNLGDEAIIAAVIHAIKEVKPDTQIIGFSINPVDTEERHKIRSYPIRRRKKPQKKQAQLSGAHHISNPQVNQQKIDSDRSLRIKQTLRETIANIIYLEILLKIILRMLRFLGSAVSEIFFLAKSFNILKMIDKLYISGSNQFLDNFGGVAGFPYTLLKWTVLARLANVKVYFLSVGAGPIKSKISMTMIKASIYLSEYVSFRDFGSKNLVHTLAGPKAGVYPDLAFSQNYLPLRSRPSNQTNKIRKIGINPMPVFDKRYWPITDEIKRQRYVESMAELYISLRNEGFHPFFYNTQHTDLLIIQDITTLIQNRRHFSSDFSDEVLVCRSAQLNELMDVISSADILVPTRYHGIILSYMAEKPLVGICYGPKSKEIISNVSHKRYAFDIEHFRANQILTEIKRIANNYDSEVKRINKLKTDYGILLKRQYGQILN